MPSLHNLLLCTLTGLILYCDSGSSIDVMADSNPNPKILVFGGNGFMGSELVHNLITQAKYEIFLVSRGNWYFDSETRIKPFVNHLICDREHSDLENCVELMEVIAANSFEVVYDFSAYKPEVLQESVELLNGKAGLYVYISSDSIYEVCVEKGVGRLSREEDGVRPEAEADQDRLNDLDEYGHEKFGGEEVLVANRASGGVPYLIVRLPDVLGPRDNTERIWAYILWIQFYEFIKVPIFIPEEVRNLRTSYVYVKDVVRALFHLIDKGIKDEVYNVGFENTLTLQDLILTLAKLLGKEREIAFDYSKNKRSFHLFPSVTRGGVDVSKLKATGFQATDFTLAMNETVEYYKTAFFTQISERDDAVHMLTKTVISRERKGEFLRFIDRETSHVPEHNEL